MWRGFRARRRAGPRGHQAIAVHTRSWEGAVAGNAGERDGKQSGSGQAPVSRRSFVVGVAAAGAAVTAGRALPGRRAVPRVADAGGGQAAGTLCGSFSLATA